MRKTVILALGLLCAAGMASAQEIDPTVEVSRAYEGELVDSEKPYYRMAVPDSVEKFHLKFDYSVFENPYKGTDSFKPYLLDLRPDSGPYSGRTLFLRAGVGYTLHPVADVVWSPKFDIPFRMSLYAHHRSYFGKYRDISVGQLQDGSYRLGRNGKSAVRGYETGTSAGMDGRTDWDGGFFSFDVGYHGVAVQDAWMERHYDAAKAGLRVASLTDEDRYFHYDVRLDYTFGTDVLSVRRDRASAALPGSVREHDVVVDATLGPMLSKEHGILLDVNLDLSAYGGLMSSHAGDFSLTPRYVFRKGRWNLDLGVMLAVLFNNDATSGAMPVMHSFKGQFVYPAVNLNFEAIRSYLDVYIKVGGGNGINSYADLLSSNRHFGYGNAGVCCPLLDNTVERVNAAFGLKGNVGSRFGYDLSAGYANVANDILFGIYVDDADTQSMHPLVGYGSGRRFFASLKCDWHSEDFRLDAGLGYRSTWGVNVRSNGLSSSSVLFVAPDFTMDLDAVYNWKKRIYVGLHCDASTSSRSVSVNPSASGKYSGVRLPGWVDLGLSAEYRFTRKLSFWLYGGNLLDMTIQRAPLFAESGISCTLGLTFNL